MNMVNSREVLQLGPVVGYDMPEYAASMKVKALHTVITANGVRSWRITLRR
jgi:hypothetical protein